MYQVSPESEDDAFKRIAKKWFLKEKLTENDKEINKDNLIEIDNTKIVFGYYAYLLIHKSGGSGKVILNTGDVYKIKKREGKYFGTQIYTDVNLAKDIESFYQNNKGRFEELQVKLHVPRLISDGSVETFFFPEQHIYEFHCLEREAGEYENLFCNIYNEYWEILKRHSLDFMFPSYCYITLIDEEYHCFLYSYDTNTDDDIIFAKDHGIIPPDSVQEYQKYLQEQKSKNDSRSNKEEEQNLKEYEKQWIRFMENEKYLMIQKQKWEQYKIDCGYVRRHPSW